MKQALEVIANFLDQETMFAYCKKHDLYFHPMELPYLTMARIAKFAGTQGE